MCYRSEGVRVLSNYGTIQKMAGHLHTRKTLVLLRDACLAALKGTEILHITKKKQTTI